MNIKGLAQILPAHGRTLDVPARAARAPGRIPLHLRRLVTTGMLPEHEIQRILLTPRNLDSLPRPQFIHRLARKLAVTVELTHGVAHVLIGGLVRQPVFHERTNQFLHRSHILGGPGLVIRTQHTQGIRILMHGGNKAVRQGADAFTVFLRPLDDLVVDIGDIANIGHLEPFRPQPAGHHVEHHHHPGVTKVTVVVNRHPAHIHPDLAGLNREKLLLFSRKGVVNFQHEWNTAMGAEKGVLVDSECRKAADVFARGRIL